MQRSIFRILAVFIATSALLSACGEDDDDTGSDDTTETTAASSTSSATSSTATETEEPGEEFCAAYRDYLAAQDGAQLNTALGAMADALPDSAPEEVVTALQTLGTGDLPPEDTAAAGATLEGWAGGACAGG